MRHIQQAKYLDASASDDAAEPLIVHHLGESAAARSNIVVFVHGLRGTRYGYWGKFPSLLSSDRSDLDVGMYYYETALRRIGFWRSIELSREAEVLAGVLRSLAAYDGILLVTHSMGGLLAKGAIAALIDGNHAAVLRKIRALVLLASPQLGSLRVPRVLTALSADARALQPHNQYITDVDQRLRARIDCSLRGDPRTKGNIPMAAVVASNDFWVDPLSARVGIPAAQCMTVRGTHRTIIQPTRPDEDAYQFVARFLAKVAGAEEAFEDSDIRVKCEAPADGDAIPLHHLAEEWFGPDVTPTEMVARLIKIPGIIKVVRVVRLQGTTKHEEIIGYFCIFPLSAAVAEQLISGELRGSQIDAKHIESDPAKCSDVYIGAVVATHFYARGTVLEELERAIAARTQGGAVNVLTRPFTDDGRRLVKKNGFVRVEPYPHDPPLFRRTFGA